MPDPADDLVLPLPPRVPRVRCNRVTRWLGRSVLRLGGWRMRGEFPDIAKLVMIAAPHSSNWDGVWGFAVKLAMGLEVKVLGKDTLLKVPVLGAMLQRMGVIPINRRAAHGVAGQMATMIRNAESLWLVVAPEGTRKPVEHWKTGFWKIAHAADVPVLPVYFHYPDKVLGVGPVFVLTDDMRADMSRIRAWYRPWQGKFHGTP